MDITPHTSLINLLSNDLISELKKAGQERHFTAGQTIHSQGDRLPGLSIITTGQVRFGIFGVNGDYIQTGILGQGHCFGEATLFTEKPRPYDAEAIGDTTILKVNKPDIDKLVAHHPSFAQALLVTLTGRLYEALEFADDLRTLSLEARIAKQLLTFHRSGGLNNHIIPVRQSDLANSLGISRVSAGKALSNLQQQGLIKLGYGEIQITDALQLETIFNLTLKRR